MSDTDNVLMEQLRKVTSDNKFPAQSSLGTRFMRAMTVLEREEYIQIQERSQK